MKSDKPNSSCDEIQNQFDLCELGLGQFDLSARKQMESHIGSCDQCKKWLSDWELIKLETQQLPQLEAPTSIVANVMSKIETTPKPVPTFAVSDLLLTVAGLALLIFSSRHYGADGIEGSMAWCLCFLILFAVSQIFKVKGQETDYAI
jgi:hypothetical protein